MRICYIVSEYFAWGQYGGYGTIARALAEGMAQRGHEVFALVNKKTEVAKREQRDIEELAGVTVVGLPHSYAKRLLRRDLYRFPRADLHVSVDARFDSWFAMKCNPRARHAIWFIDPMPFETFWNQHRENPEGARPGERIATRIVFEGLRRFSRLAVRDADGLLSQPQELSESARAVYPTPKAIHFAPNPVDVPTGAIEKAARPLVLFLGRFDWQKQPEVFFELARRMPEIDFTAAGTASDPARDAELRARFGEIPNLALPGVVDGEEKDRLLRRAWILCNTSLREGLPRSFQEALAFRCALVAGVDPDQLVSRFGHYAADRDFETGIRKLITADAWKSLGAAGHEFMGDTYATARALDAHESLYRELLS